MKISDIFKKKTPKIKNYENKELASAVTKLEKFTGNSLEPERHFAALLGQERIIDAHAQKVPLNDTNKQKLSEAYETIARKHIGLLETSDRFIGHPIYVEESLNTAINLYKKAYTHTPTDHIQTHIAKLEKRIHACDQDAETVVTGSIHSGTYPWHKAKTLTEQYHNAHAAAPKQRKDLSDHITDEETIKPNNVIEFPARQIA